MKASDIAKKASELVAGERDRTHGDKHKNFENIATMWNAWLAVANKRPNRPLDAHDVATMMECLKIARRVSGSVNVDDYTDSAGYAACAGEIAALKDEAEQRLSRVA